MAKKDEQLKHCMWCGSVLEKTDKFCSECGEKVPEIVEVDGTRDSINPFRGLDLVAGEEIPAEETQRINKDDVADKVVYAPTGANKVVNLTNDTAVDKKRPSTKQILKVLAMVAVMVLSIAAALVIILHFVPKLSAIHEHEQAIEKLELSDSSLKAEEKTASGSQEELTDEDSIYSVLSALYANLSSYNKRYATCVQEFNGNFAVKDITKRSRMAQDVKTLYADVKAGLEDLEVANISESSVYAEDAKQVRLMYETMLGRVDPLVRAWDVSLAYETPYPHRQEILSELARDYVNGKNPYIDAFDKAYFGHEPTKKHEDAAEQDTQDAQDAQDTQGGQKNDGDPTDANLSS